MSPSVENADPTSSHLDCDPEVDGIVGAQRKAFSDEDASPSLVRISHDTRRLLDAQERLQEGTQDISWWHGPCGYEEMNPTFL
jgi:hypothetical protein